MLDLLTTLKGSVTAVLNFFAVNADMAMNVNLDCNTTIIHPRFNTFHHKLIMVTLFGEGRSLNHIICHAVTTCVYVFVQLQSQRMEQCTALHLLRLLHFSVVHTIE